MTATASESGIVVRPISYSCGPCGRLVEECACRFIAALARLQGAYANGNIGLVELVQRGSYILCEAMESAPGDMQGMIETINARTALPA